MTVTGPLAWLGGGPARDLPEGHERSGYVVTGLGVLLFAAVTGVVTALAVHLAHRWPAAGIIALALLTAVLAATLGRALATRRPGHVPDRFGLGARIGVGVVAGLLVGELACTVLFDGTVDRLLDEQAQREVASAPGVLAATTALDAARAERAALDREITAAQTDIDRALIIARCEFNPTPECPQTRITGVPGRGPEARTAESMLEDSRAQLAAARARVGAVDDRVAERDLARTAAERAAFAESDRGLGARWLALHDRSLGDAGTLLLRLLTLAAFVLLALLPLILRWWRGETSHDRRAAYRAVTEQAELEADTAIARKRAQVRAEAEALRADQELTATRLAVEADTAIDRERQRTRVIAAIGGLELGITEPRRGGETRGIDATPRLAELPAADPKDDIVTERPSHLPAAVPAQPAPQGGLALPIIGQVPFTDTAARWIRPLVPGFVAEAIDTATHPLRTVRQVFEEAEEITFTLRRTRKVTVDTPITVDPHGTPITGPEQARASYARQVAAEVVDGYVIDAEPPRGEVGGSRGAAVHRGRGTRELPPGS